MANNPFRIQGMGIRAEAQRRYGLGRETMKKAALQAGAVIRIGRAWLVNFSVMDQYMDQLSGSGNRER